MNKVKYMGFGRRWDVLTTTSTSAVCIKGGVNFLSRLVVISILGLTVKVRITRALGSINGFVNQSRILDQISDHYLDYGLQYCNSTRTGNDCSANFRQPRSQRRDFL